MALVSAEGAHAQGEESEEASTITKGALMQCVVTTTLVPALPRNEGKIKEGAPGGCLAGSLPYSPCCAMSSERLDAGIGR